MAEWVLDLCDKNGTRLCGLPTAAGKRFHFKRNYYGEVTFTISHADDAARTLVDYLNISGWPTLSAYRDGVLRFRGHLAPFSEELEESTTMNLVFRGPFSRLLGDGSGRGRFTDEYGSYNDDAGVVAADLIDHWGSGAGLGIGPVESTKVRDRAYEYANIGESIIELSQMFDGFDFEEVYVETGSALAEFRVYARMGTDKPGARFEYGPATMANCRPVSRETQQPANFVTATGSNGAIATREDPSSITKYGLWPMQVSVSDVDDDAILGDVAQANVRPNPIRTISFIPELGMANCPRPWDDYWLGDTIRFYGRRDAFEENVSARVNEIVLVVDDNGNEAAEVPDPVDPDSEATLRAALAVEVDTYESG